MQNKLSLKFILLNLDVAIASISMCVLVALTFAGVIARYVIGSPFTWIEEIQAAMIIWVVFGAAGAAFRTANHAAIEVFYEFFPDFIKKLLNFMILIITLCTLIYLGYYAINYLKIFARSGRTTAVLHISFILIYIIVPVSCVWQIFNFIIVKFFNYSEAFVLEGISDEELKQAQADLEATIKYESEADLKS